jgi:hypothetical protein
MNKKAVSLVYRVYSVSTDNIFVPIYDVYLRMCAVNSVMHITAM